MAELIYLCERDSEHKIPNQYFNTIANRITPENAPSQTKIVRSNSISYCIINPSIVLQSTEKSVCMGQMIPYKNGWDQPNTSPPDGTYGIIRANKDIVELVSDMTASRTIYYYIGDEFFISSTSQRAIMHFLDSFVPDESSIAWMVSSGSLGPRMSWDKRIQTVPADSRVQLDRHLWEITTTKGTAWTPFTPDDRSEEYHRNQLHKALTDTFNNLGVDITKWHITLSGGVDSRELLRRLHSRSGITSGTRTGAEAIGISKSDPTIAKNLADAYGVPHRFHLIPTEPYDVEKVFERMVVLSEGRVATVPRMADGFAEYAHLTTNGIDGIIRGDEGFGWRTVNSSRDVRRAVGGKMLSDYDDILSNSYEQVWPDRFTQQQNESLQSWRDRLYHTYRGATYLAAWNSLKTPYVEVVNPLLTRRVLNTVRKMPDDLRTNKSLFSEYVIGNSVDIPEANRSGCNLTSFLDSRRTREFLRDELDSGHADQHLEEIIEYTVNQIDPENDDKSQTNVLTFDAVKKKIGRRLPSKFNQVILEYTPVTRSSRSLSSVRLAVRLYTIQSIFEKFEEDIEFTSYQ